MGMIHGAARSGAKRWLSLAGHRDRADRAGCVADGPSSGRAEFAGRDDRLGVLGRDPRAGSELEFRRGVATGVSMSMQG
jgi:hypothetical protein